MHPTKAAFTLLKFKCLRDQEFVISGYTAPKGSRVGLGALLVGYHEDGRLAYAGKVGTGFDTPRCAACISGCPDRAGQAAGHRRSSTSSAPTGFADRGGPGGIQRVDARRQAAPSAVPGVRTDKNPGDVVRESR